MTPDLEPARGFFAASPFRVARWAEADGGRTLVMKASATMAVTAARR